MRSSTPGKLTPHEENTLRTIWDGGKSDRLIGDALSRTKGSIVGHRHRLKLFGRPSPIRPRGDVPNPPRKRVETLPVLASVATPIVTSIPAFPPAARAKLPIIPRQPAYTVPPLRPVEGRISPCQFPLWPHQARPPIPPTFCDVPSEPGLSCCESHCRVIFAGAAA